VTAKSKAEAARLQTRG